jgi:hypothetical protein
MNFKSPGHSDLGRAIEVRGPDKTLAAHKERAHAAHFGAFARLFFACARSLFARPRRSMAMPFARLGLPEVAGFSSAIFCFSASTSSYCDISPRPISQSFKAMRIASESDGLGAGCEAIHLFKASVIPAGMRKLTNGSRPVAGRPRFFGLTGIDFAIKTV